MKGILFPKLLRRKQKAKKQNKRTLEEQGFIKDEGGGGGGVQWKELVKFTVKLMRIHYMAVGENSISGGSDTIRAKRSQLPVHSSKGGKG